jgi:hypothetical protein
LGDPRDAYTSADKVHPEFRQPEVPGRFKVTVEGETMINTMHGPQSVDWRAEPGDPCLIRGYWEDGTVHVQWAAISGTYRIDGRFPAWAVEPDYAAQMAGGGRILRANNPIVLRRRLPAPTVLLLVAIVIVVALVFFFFFNR